MHGRMTQSKSTATEISRELVWSIIHEDLNMRMVSAKCVPKWLNEESNIQGASLLSKFWNFFGVIQNISCRNWWPWKERGYSTIIRRRNNIQWNGRMVAHPAPKFPNAKIHWKISRLDFFGGSKGHRKHWLFSKGLNHQRGVLCVSAGAIEAQIEGKTPRETHQVCVVLVRKPPNTPGTCNPEETGLNGLPES